MKLGPSFHVPQTEGHRCPICDLHLNGATPTDGQMRLDPGDYTVCIRCGTPLEVQPDFSFVVIPDDKAKKIPLLRDLLDYVRSMIGRKGEGN